MDLCDQFQFFLQNQSFTKSLPVENQCCQKKKLLYHEHGKDHAKGKELVQRIFGGNVSTSTYLLNKCPTKKLEDITPEESWYEFKQKMSHLRVFDSVSYRQVPNQLRKKLNNKGE